MTRHRGAVPRQWARRALAVLMIISASSLGVAASGTGEALASGVDGNHVPDASHGEVIQNTATTAGLARQLLAMWGGKVTGLPGAHSDLVATSRNHAIKNAGSCGKAVRVDIRVLKFLVRVTARYKIKINNIITGHRCDSARHPRGRATDLGGAWDLATGAATSFGGYWGRDNPGVDRTFVNYISTILPNGSGLGQRDCPGRSSAHPRAGVAFFRDSCTHQHVQV